MPSSMRMALSATTALGLMMIAFALSGISGLAPRLAAATPARAVPQHLNEEIEHRFQGVSERRDCRPAREWKKL
jgi:hypothetical protein